MLDSGSTRKYLLYAVGEILLVMIGILLALQVNNWNENRKKGTLELAFLEKLSDDLVKDTSYYIEQIDDLNKSTAQFELYVPKSYQIQKDRAQFINLMKPLRWSSDIFTSENSTFEELKNTGQLGIFRNDSLKDAFLALQRAREQINILVSSTI